MSGNHISNEVPLTRVRVRSSEARAVQDGPVPDDVELVQQIGRGDERAFQTLVDRHARYLYGVAHGLAGNPADAEDLVQETFTGALKTHFRGEASVRTWLVQILVRRVSMLRRSKRRLASRLRFDSQAIAEPHDYSPSASASTDARLDLATMLETLSPEHRAVIVLREIQGMSYEQMAGVLRIPRGTVESRLHRAREELRKRFKGYLS